MLKIVGAALLLAGTAGFSFCLCKERKKRLFYIKELQRMYRLFQSEIGYTGLPLPEIFLNVSEKLPQPLKDGLQRVSRAMAPETGESFERVWEREMGPCFSHLSIKEELGEVLLGFPECVSSFEREGQAKAFERYIRETERWIVRMEEEEKSQNKVIMSLGIAAGVFLIIILL